MITLNFSFPTVAEAQHVLALIAAGIPYADRPDVGAAPTAGLSFAHASAVPVNIDRGVVTNPFAQGGAAEPATPTAPVVALTVAAAAPTPPIAATVPTVAPLTATPTPVSSPPVTGVELDAQGLPWDGRIHGSTKTKNADSTWRQKRGLNDAALKARVEAELRAGQAARAPAGSVAPPAVVPVFVPPPPPAVVPVFVPPPPPAAVLSEAAATPFVPTPPATATETFGTLMLRLAPVAATDPAAKTKIDAVLAQFGMTALAQLGARPDLVPAFGQCADAALAA